MYADWEMAKNEYIKMHFCDERLMKIAENAFNGDVCSQEYLAEYFAKQGDLVGEKIWRQKVKLNRDCRGEVD